MKAAYDRPNGADDSLPHRRPRGAYLVALTALALVGCGGRTQEHLEVDGSGGAVAGSASADGGSKSGAPPSGGGGAGEPPPPSCVPALGEKLVAHACSHTANGPFLSVVAGDELTAPDVSELHRTYEVQLVGPGARLRYRAQREGAHAFMTNVPVSLEVRRAGRDSLAPSPSFPVTGCSQVTSATVYQLERGTEYEVTLRESPVELQLFIEHLGAFGAKAWAEPCEAASER